MDFVDRAVAEAQKQTSPLKVIRAFCIRCVNSVRVEAECIEPECPLFDFRGGKNTRIKRKPMTLEHKEKLADGLKRFKDYS